MKIFKYFLGYLAFSILIFFAFFFIFSIYSASMGISNWTEGTRAAFSIILGLSQLIMIMMFGAVIILKMINE